MLAGRTTVKALALADDFRARWERRHAAAIEGALTRGGRGDTHLHLGLGLAAATTVTLTAIGAVAIVNQEITIGALIAANMLTNRIVGPFNQLVGIWRHLAHYKQAAARLDDLFALPEDRRESAVALDRPRGEVTLEAIRFGYDPKQPPVIDGVSLKIAPGGMVGIVGGNGGGKTTLLKLMRGLYAPSEGRVLFDGADIGQFTQRELARWIGYVPQDCVLFAGSIRDNIALGHARADDQAIVAAARQAGLHDVVLDLPDGYASDVGEGGMLLSGGIRQRVAIARALVGDPPLLLLDEVASNLDLAAQGALRARLVELAADHGVVLVSHAPALLSACSLIVALDHGRVVAAGAAAEILPRLMGAGARPAVKEVAR